VVRPRGGCTAGVVCRKDGPQLVVALLASPGMTVGMGQHAPVAVTAPLPRSGIPRSWPGLGEDRINGCRAARFVFGRAGPET